LQNEASNTGNIVAGILNHIAKMVTQHIGTLRKYNAKLSQQSANSVDAGSALLFEPLSESMDAKHALLSQCFGRNKIDMRPRRCLTDCRSVVRIVLTSTTLYTVAAAEPFLKGPIPMWWIAKAAHLPGKTLAVGMAIWWLRGMAQDKPFKLTQKALDTLAVSPDAAYDGLRRLEAAGLVKVTRAPGQRATIDVLLASAKRKKPANRAALYKPDDGFND